MMDAHTGMDVVTRWGHPHHGRVKGGVLTKKNSQTMPYRQPERWRDHQGQPVGTGCGNVFVLALPGKLTAPAIEETWDGKLMQWQPYALVSGVDAQLYGKPLSSIGTLYGFGVNSSAWVVLFGPGDAWLVECEVGKEADWPYEPYGVVRCRSLSTGQVVSRDYHYRNDSANGPIITALRGLMFGFDAQSNGAEVRWRSYFSGAGIVCHLLQLTRTQVGVSWVFSELTYDVTSGRVATGNPNLCHNVQQVATSWTLDWNAAQIEGVVFDDSDAPLTIWWHFASVGESAGVAVVDPAPVVYWLLYAKSVVTCELRIGTRDQYEVVLTVTRTAEGHYLTDGSGGGTVTVSVAGISYTSHGERCHDSSVDWLSFTNPTPEPEWIGVRRLTNKVFAATLTLLDGTFHVLATFAPGAIDRTVRSYAKEADWPRFATYHPVTKELICNRDEPVCFV